MPTAKSPRYYTFSERSQFRGRVPQPHDGSDADAIAYAQAVKADNVVREDGPMNKPTLHQLWHHSDPPRNTEAERVERFAKIYEVLVASFPYAPVTKIRDVAHKIEENTR